MRGERGLGARLHPDGGLSYLEVLVAVVLVAAALVPALEALRGGLVGAQVHADLATESYRLTGRMEEVLAEPFATLDAEALALGSPTTPSAVYSDPAGTPGRRLVYLSRYDGDNADGDADPFTGVDGGLLRIRVEIELGSHAVETLRARGSGG